MSGKDDAQKGQKNAEYYSANHVYRKNDFATPLKAADTKSSLANEFKKMHVHVAVDNADGREKCPLTDNMIQLFLNYWDAAIHTKPYATASSITQMEIATAFARYFSSNLTQKTISSADIEAIYTYLESEIERYEDMQRKDESILDSTVRSANIETYLLDRYRASHTMWDATPSRDMAVLSDTSADKATKRIDAIRTELHSRLEHLFASVEEHPIGSSHRPALPSYMQKNLHKTADLIVDYMATPEGNIVGLVDAKRTLGNAINSAFNTVIAHHNNTRPEWAQKSFNQEFQKRWCSLSANSYLYHHLGIGAEEETARLDAQNRLAARGLSAPQPINITQYIDWFGPGGIQADIESAEEWNLQNFDYSLSTLTVQLKDENGESQSTPFMDVPHATELIARFRERLENVLNTHPCKELSMEAKQIATQHALESAAQLLEKNAPHTEETLADTLRNSEQFLTQKDQDALYEHGSFYEALYGRLPLTYDWQPNAKDEPYIQPASELRLRAERMIEWLYNDDAHNHHAFPPLQGGYRVLFEEMVDHYIINPMSSEEAPQDTLRPKYPTEPTNIDVLLSQPTLPIDKNCQLIEALLKHMIKEEQNNTDINQLSSDIPQFIRNAKKAVEEKRRIYGNTTLHETPLESVFYKPEEEAHNLQPNATVSAPTAKDYRTLLEKLPKPKTPYH